MPSAAPAVEQAELFMIWTLDEGHEQARRGHAYLFAGREYARWVSLEHSAATTPTMLELLTRWEAAHPPTPTLEQRRRTQWPEPGGRWRFHGDLGGVREMLLTRRLVPESYDFGPDSPRFEPLPPLPETFMAGPIATLIRAQLGPLRWPSRFEAPHVCVGPRGLVSARAGDELVVCAARPGSIYADSGQTRTAAVWCSHDGGASWTELNWELEARDDVRGSWPPEQIDKLTLVDGAPVIEWDDPWIDWEPGNQWRATWMPAQQRWHADTRD